MRKKIGDAEGQHPVAARCRAIYGEGAAGHLERATLKPLDKLRSTLSDLDPQKPVAAHCKSGYRSSIATSILQAAGFKNALNVVGGLDAWQAHQLPHVADQTSAQTCAG